MSGNPELHAQYLRQQAEALQHSAATISQTTTPNQPNPTMPPATSPTRQRAASISLPPGTILKTEESILSEDSGIEAGMAMEAGVQASLEEEIGMAHETLYQQGLLMRKKVLGEEFVEEKLRAEREKGGFGVVWTGFATEAAWGSIWTRPGLELKTRSMLNLGMLTALGKWTELGTHVRGAIRNGCTEVEIQECLLQATAYCGMPAGAEAFRTAEKALIEMEERGEYKRGGMTQDWNGVH